MQGIFPVFVKEIQSQDIYTFKDLRDFKIFVEEMVDILDEFEAWTSDGKIIKLDSQIILFDNLEQFIVTKQT